MRGNVKLDIHDRYANTTALSRNNVKSVSCCTFFRLSINLKQIKSCFMATWGETQFQRQQINYGKYMHVYKEMSSIRVGVHTPSCIVYKVFNT